MMLGNPHIMEMVQGRRCEYMRPVCQREKRLDAKRSLQVRVWPASVPSSLPVLRLFHRNAAEPTIGSNVQPQSIR